MANIITGLRIIISIVLLLCPPLSTVFYIFYLVAGISDMIDGSVARKTGTVSEFGSKLDTIADFAFVTVCLIKLLPTMDIPSWIYIWTALVALIKLINIVLGFIKHNKIIAVHSVMNKVTGISLFIFPLLLPFIDLKFGAAVICIIATAAAVQESYYIGTRSEMI